ncbi:hypothetical protein [Pararhizobium haloflavum]|uniref:hypothetical protein n=1 Tax=Pararhizobium haloflavum TaxID=2037914 RepID=UPI0018E43742|nr:hypothetical protein [Pararhizobium haloflavum]
MNKTIAVIALAVLAAFLGILIYEVPRLDLSVVVGITILLAAYDFLKPNNRSS